MKKRLLLLLVAMLVAAVAVPALAQPGGTGSNRLVSFGLGGGVTVPVSDAKDAFKNGFNGQGFARLNLRQLPIVPRLDFTFSKFDVKSAKLASPTASGTGQVFAGLASLQYFLMPGPIRPYVIAGLGAYNIKTDVTGVPGAGSSTDTRFGVNGGGGVLVKLGGLMSAYVEGHIDNVFSDKGGFVNTKQIQVVPVTLGIVF
jgi:opacity protein-like surface antigen